MSTVTMHMFPLPGKLYMQCERHSEAALQTSLSASLMRTADTPPTASSASFGFAKNLSLSSSSYASEVPSARTQVACCKQAACRQAD